MIGDEQHLRFVQTLLPAGYAIVKVSEGKRGRRPGQTHTAETKAKISRALTGRKLSAETKRRISESRKFSYADRVHVLQQELDLLRQQLARRGA